MTPSISAEQRAEYDSLVMGLSTTAEELADPAAAFVETSYAQILKARQHQIVYGRRGTGKTHLFRRVASGLTESFSDDRMLPVYLNGRQLGQEVGLVSADPAVVALGIYVQMMQRLAAEVYRLIRELHQSSAWDRIVGTGGARVGRQADEVARLLRETLTAGQVRLLPRGEASTVANMLSETSRSASAEASVKVSDPRSLGWSLGGALAASARTNRSTVTTLKISGEVILPFSQVSLYLQRLLSLLGDAALMVLLDEWSEVDKDPQVQPHLAEMLRRTASAIPHMYFKLACIPGRTRLATPITTTNRNPIGLEEGDDIHRDVNLDSIAFVPERLDELAPFLVLILKKHVGQRLKWVREMAGEDFMTFLTSAVFEGTPPFVELCQASGGVPRDFMNVYREATTRAVEQERAGMPHRALRLFDVRQAARRVYESKRASFRDSNSPELRLLDAIYGDIYVPRNSYYFLLSARSAENDLVQTLFMEKLIHRIPITYYDRNEDRRYEYFQLDYGRTIDRLESSGKNQPGIETSRWARLSPQSLGTFLVDRFRDLKSSFTAVAGTPPGRLDVDPRDIILPDERVEGFNPTVTPSP